MRFVKRSLLVVAACGAGHAFAAPPEVVRAAVDEVFVAKGFDDNDDIVVTLDGFLPNSCYKLGKVDVVTDPVTRRVEVVQYALRYSGANIGMQCFDLLVPFSTTVSLGMLPHGDFSVVSNSTNGGDVMSTLTVDEAQTAGPDNFLYAPIEAATVARQNGQMVATLSGRFTNSCMRIADVRVINSGKTVEVLPVLDESAIDAPGCVARESNFSVDAQLPADVGVGRHLLHVRSLNGRSVNTVFSVPQF